MTSLEAAFEVADLGYLLWWWEIHAQTIEAEEFGPRHRLFRSVGYAGDCIEALGDLLMTPQQRIATEARLADERDQAAVRALRVLVMSQTNLNFDGRLRVGLA